MWEFVDSYQIWIMLAIVIGIILFGRVGGRGCGGHGDHECHRGGHLRQPQDPKAEMQKRMSEMMGAPQPEKK